MPFGSEGVEPGTGLALSGGGFRATLFHCGALWRLNELGILAKLDRVSSVSGGSITAGVLATRWRALRFQGDLAVNLGELVVEPLRAFCHRTVDAPAIGLGALLPGRRPSDLLQAAYAEHLYGAATLPPLGGQPSPGREWRTTEKGIMSTTPSGKEEYHAYLEPSNLSRRPAGRGDAAGRVRNSSADRRHPDPQRGKRRHPEVA